jgi:hypothetical protein
MLLGDALAKLGKLNEAEGAYYSEQNVLGASVASSVERV